MDLIWYLRLQIPSIDDNGNSETICEDIFKVQLELTDMIPPHSSCHVCKGELVLFESTIFLTVP